MLGKEAVLLGETAETPGFKLKPAEAPPAGRSQDEEIWNAYQDLQQQLSRSTHKESEPVCERGKELCDNFCWKSCDSNLFRQNIMSIFWVPSLWICKYSRVSNYDPPLFPPSLHTDSVRIDQLWVKVGVGLRYRNIQTIEPW